MSNRLATYLNDHLAGARFAIDLLERLQDAYPDEPLGRSMQDLLGKIEDDRAVLQGLADRVRSDGNAIKEAVAWMAEKASRLKLSLGADAELGVFESLEAVSLGVLGKLALWRALAAVAPSDPRLQDIDYDRLAERALSQHAELEALRIDAARAALPNS